MSMKLILIFALLAIVLSKPLHLTKEQEKLKKEILKEFNPTQVNNITDYKVNPTLCLAATFYYQDTFRNYSKGLTDTKILFEEWSNATQALRIVGSYCSLDFNNYTWLNDTSFGISKHAQKTINLIEECKKKHKSPKLTKELMNNCSQELDQLENPQQQDNKMVVDFFGWSSITGAIGKVAQLGSDVYNVASSCSEIGEGVDHIEEGFETAGIIDAAGGGPEDPVGDVIAAVVGGVEAGYGVYQVVKGGIDAVQGVKKTVHDLNNDFGGGENDQEAQENSESPLGLNQESLEGMEDMINSPEFQNEQMNNENGNESYNNENGNESNNFENGNESNNFENGNENTEGGNENNGNENSGNENGESGEGQSGNGETEASFIDINAEPSTVDFMQLFMDLMNN